MFKCVDCNKVFKYDSKLKEHQNRKISCIAPKKEYKCELCNVIFICPAEKLRHEKTKKHLTNTNNFNIKTEKIYSYEKLLEKYNKLENDNKELIQKNINLENELFDLKNKFNILEKLSNNIHDESEFIYIMHERTFVKTKSNVYKIGQTKDIKNRMNGYAKGSKLLYTIQCSDSKKLEKIILNYLKSNDKYIQVKEYGNEYFSCDLKCLTNDIHNLVKIHDGVESTEIV